MLHCSCVVCLLGANRSTSSWKSKSFLSSASTESYVDGDEQRRERPAYKRTLECSDSEIDDNDDYASFRGKKKSKKKAGIEANRARNLSPSGSEVMTDYWHVLYSCGDVMCDKHVSALHTHARTHAHTHTHTHTHQFALSET